MHVLTVNDYLARRDAEWMEPVYRLLGLTVGWVTESSTREERREAYACDVTYVSVSEAGFDYLRDQLVTDVDDRVQRGAGHRDRRRGRLDPDRRGPGADGAGRRGPRRAGPGARRRRAGPRPATRHATTRSPRTAAASRFTAAGLAAVEAKLGGINLYDDEHVEQLSAINVALHAHALLHRDVDYIVRDGAVELIDEMRGRVAQRRRWPDGLQAAVEAKEGLDATAEGEVLGTITVQAYIALYPNAVRHDRDRGARRRPAAGVLQARGRGDPAEHAVHPRGRAGPDLRHPGGEGRGADRGDQGVPRGGPAGAGRHPRREGVRGAGRGAARGRRAVRACSTPRTTPRRRRSSPRPARTAR